MHTCPCTLGWGQGPPGSRAAEQALQQAGTWSPSAYAGQGQRGHGRDTGLGCKELLPGCLCLAAAGFDSWYSPPFSGIMLGSALRMRRPRSRKTPGLKVLPGMLCMSGDELRLGLKSVAGVPEVPGQLKLALATGCAMSRRGRRRGSSQNPLAPHQPSRLSLPKPCLVRVTCGAGKARRGQALLSPRLHCPILAGIGCHSLSGFSSSPTHPSTPWSGGCE